MDPPVNLRLYFCILGLQEKCNMFYALLHSYFLLEHTHPSPKSDINFNKEKLHLIVSLSFHINPL